MPVDSCGRSSFAQTLWNSSRSLVRSFQKSTAMTDDIRETFIKKYRMIYQVVTNEVRILAVVHGARELPTTIVDRVS